MRGRNLTTKPTYLTPCGTCLETVRRKDTRKFKAVNICLECWAAIQRLRINDIIEGYIEEIEDEYDE